MLLACIAAGALDYANKVATNATLDQESVATCSKRAYQTQGCVWSSH